MGPDSPVLRLESVAFRPDGRTLSLEVYPGEVYAVMGRPSSGKSRLLECIAGSAKPSKGRVVVETDVVFPERISRLKRTTPLGIGKAALRRGDSGRLVGALTALSLSGCRDKPFGQLTPSQILAASLLPCFVQETPLAVIDGDLDTMDVATLAQVLDMIQDEAEGGRSFIIATGRPDVATAAGQVVLLRDGEVSFAGTCRELIGACGPVDVTVDCSDSSVVANLVAPLVVSAKETERGLELSTHSGQALAAKLLTHGYGNVRTVVVREPTISEAVARFC